MNDDDYNKHISLPEGYVLPPQEVNSMESDSKSVQPIPVAEALKRIPVSREFFYRAIKSGKLPSYRLGRRVFVDVDECLAAMRVDKKAFLPHSSFQIIDPAPKYWAKEAIGKPWLATDPENPCRQWRETGKHCSRCPYDPVCNS